MTENESAKPRVEVVEETQESLEIIEQARMPRPDKMASEARLVEDAHEARFVEREFVRRHKEPLDAVRAAVDALTPKAVEFPEARPPPAPLPPEPAPEPEAPSIPDELRAALEPVLPGPLRAAEIVHGETTGNVVEATYERADGSTATALYVVTDGVARPFEDIAARIDALPTPEIEVAPPPVVKDEPAPAEEPEADSKKSEKKGGLLGRFGKKEATEEAATEPAAEEKPQKKGGLLGRLGKKSETAEPEEPAAAETPQEDAPKKGLLGRFGKKSDAEPAEPSSPSEAEAEDAPKKGLLGRLGRKKKEEPGAQEEASTTAEVAQETPVEEAPSKKRFSLRRK